MSENIQLWVLGHAVTYIETIGNYSLLEVSVTPGIPGPPPHYHLDAPELFHVIEGRIEVFYNGEWKKVDQGESLMIPVNAIHTFRNPDPQPARFVTTWAPRGFEGFFLEFGIPFDVENSFEISISDEMIARVTAECEKYGMIIVK
jgi:mannose-6-phosphate isomerase-like protein (cupin superfamily)